MWLDERQEEETDEWDDQDKKEHGNMNKGRINGKNNIKEHMMTTKTGI
jgi:hypothetical protein